MIEYYDLLNEEEQDDMRDLIRLLLRQTFLLERKYDRRAGRMVPVREYRFADRHLDFLAHRLDDCDGSVHRVLRLRSLGAHPRRIVLSYDHPCVCMGGRFFRRGT